MRRLLQMLISCMIALTFLSYLPFPADADMAESYEILGDYFINPDNGAYAKHIVVIRNPSDVSKQFTVHFWYYGENGEQVDEYETVIWAVDPGCASYVQQFVNVQEHEITSWETGVVAEGSGYSFFPILEELTATWELSGNKALVSVTNTGGRIAEYPQGIMLFFRDDKLIDAADGSFFTEEYDLMPGDTATKKLTAYYAENYDRVEFYLDSSSLERIASSKEPKQLENEKEDKVIVLEEFIVRKYKTAYYYAVIENVSEEPLGIRGSVTAFSDQGQKLDIKEDSVSLSPGQKGVLTAYFDDPDANIYCEMELREKNAGSILPESVTVDRIDITHGCVFVVTNNSDRILDYLSAYAFFQKDGRVISAERISLADNSHPFPSGSSFSSVVNIGSDFDDVQFFFRY